MVSCCAASPVLRSRPAESPSHHLCYHILIISRWLSPGSYMTPSIRHVSYSATRLRTSQQHPRSDTLAFHVHFQRVWTLSDTRCFWQSNRVCSFRLPGGVSPRLQESRSLRSPTPKTFVTGSQECRLKSSNFDEYPTQADIS